MAALLYRNRLVDKYLAVAVRPGLGHHPHRFTFLELLAEPFEVLDLVLQTISCWTPRLGQKGLRQDYFGQRTPCICDHISLPLLVGERTDRGGRSQKSLIPAEDHLA